MRKLSFGCVNYWSKGSHDDMDYELFIKSKNSIIKSLNDTPWEEIHDFNELRKAGLIIENRMFEATNGVNTHKGLIFLHMFLAKAYMDDVSWQDLKSYTRSLAKALLDDYKKKRKARNWEYYDLEDIRSYPLSGFTSLCDLVDKLYTKDISDLYLTIYLIAKTDDTTTFQRSSLETLKILQNKASEILKISSRKEFYKKAKALSDYYQANHISSGGVADLFTTIRTLEYLRKDFDD